MSSAIARNVSASWPSGSRIAVMVGDACTGVLVHRISRPQRRPRGASLRAEALVAREHVVEAFLVQHREPREAVQHLRRRRVGAEAVLFMVEHLVPGPERFRQLRGLGGRRAPCR